MQGSYQVGGDQVSITARFPIMNAIDCLVSVHELIAWRPKSHNSHGASLVSLCRTALSSRRRSPSGCFQARIASCAEARASDSIPRTQCSTQRSYSALGSFSNPIPIGCRVNSTRISWSTFDCSTSESTRCARPKTRHPRSKCSATKVVQSAARWIDQNPPVHAAKDGGPYGNSPHGFEDAAVSFYRHSSAIMHGLKWPLDYMPDGEVDLSRLIVNGVNIAVGTAKCAVALYEAQAQQRIPRITRQRHYPRRLTPTIRAMGSSLPRPPEYNGLLTWRTNNPNSASG